MNVFLGIWAFLGSFYLFYLGWVLVVDQDKAWEWQLQKNEKRGISESRRSYEWESTTRSQGIMFIGLGIFVLLCSIIMLSNA